MIEHNLNIVLITHIMEYYNLYSNKTIFNMNVIDFFMVESPQMIVPI